MDGYFMEKSDKIWMITGGTHTQQCSQQFPTLEKVFGDIYGATVKTYMFPTMFLL